MLQIDELFDDTVKKKWSMRGSVSIFALPAS